MIVRSYAVTAAESREDQLRAALLALAAQVLAMPGAVRMDVLRDQKFAAQFLFVEMWDTADAAASAGKVLGREAFAPIMAALASPPVTAQYDVC